MLPYFWSKRKKDYQKNTLIDKHLTELSKQYYTIDDKIKLPLINSDISKHESLEATNKHNDSSILVKQKLKLKKGMGEIVVGERRYSI